MNESGLIFLVVAAAAAESPGSSDEEAATARQQAGEVVVETGDEKEGEATPQKVHCNLAALLSH